jgi:flagellar hook-associated protein 3 FlgL
MRISNNSVYENIKYNLELATQALIEANNVVSSTKKINRLSDDPVGLANVLDLRASLADIAQIGRNIGTGQSWLSAGENALTQIEDLLAQTKTLTVEMSSATKTASQRQNAAATVDGYLRQVASLANTQVNGRYIFGGTVTDTQSFTFDNETTPTLMTYNGNNTAFAIRIGQNSDIEVGRDGADVFGTNWDDDNIFKTLIDLKNNLQTNNVGGVQSAMNILDDNLNGVRTKIANTGSKILRLDVKQSIIDDMSINYTERKSKIEDADIAEAIMNLKAKELAYQAVLSSSSKVMDLSLVNYL